MSMYDGYSKAGLIFGGSGGTGPSKDFLINAIINTDGNTISIDKTYEDIVSAYDSEKNMRVVAKFLNPIRYVEFDSVVKKVSQYVFIGFEGNIYLELIVAPTQLRLTKTPIQSKLSAGENITISDNGIISSNQPTAPNPYKLTYTNGNGTDAYDGSLPKMITLEKLNGASKDFVNSSIATNTAFFKGTYDVKKDLGFENYEVSDEDIVLKLNSISCEKGEEPKEGDKILDVTNNDYLFVSDEDSSGNVIYIRYKYNKDQSSTWIREYVLNNSSFTAEQWATIQSGITSADKTQITTNTSAIADIVVNMPDSPEDVNAQPEALIIRAEVDYEFVITIIDDRYITEGAVDYEKLFSDAVTKFNAGIDVVLRVDFIGIIIDLKCNCLTDERTTLIYEGHNMSTVIVVALSNYNRSQDPDELVYIEIAEIYDIEAIDHIEDHEFLDDYLTTAGAQKDYFQKKIDSGDNKLPADYVSDIVKTTGASQQKIVANGSTATDTPLVLRSSSNKTEGFIGFENGEGKSLGYLGVDSNKKPVFYDSANHELALKSDIPTIPSNIVKGYDINGSATAYNIQVVSALPTSPSDTTIYLVIG